MSSICGEEGLGLAHARTHITHAHTRARNTHTHVLKYQPFVKLNEFT